MWKTTIYNHHGIYILPKGTVKMEAFFKSFFIVISQISKTQVDSVGKKSLLG